MPTKETEVVAIAVVCNHEYENPNTAARIEWPEQLAVLEAGRRNDGLGRADCKPWRVVKTTTTTRVTIEEIS